MPLRVTAASLPRAGQTDSVVERLAEQLLFEGGRRTSPSERRSWERSLPVLADDLLEAGLQDVDVLLEYQLPLTSQRADVVLAGTHPDTGRPSYVVVELKQWSAARTWEDDVNLVEVDGMPGGPKQHPVKQVRGYATHIADFARALRGDDEAVAGAAYLHNATNREAVSDLFALPIDLHGSLYTGADRHAFRQFSAPGSTPSRAQRPPSCCSARRLHAHHPRWSTGSGVNRPDRLPGNPEPCLISEVPRDRSAPNHVAGQPYV